MQSQPLMSRQMARMIVSAIAAGGVAGGGALATAMTGGADGPTTPQLWLSGALAIVAMFKDIQASLSSPPKGNA